MRRFLLVSGLLLFVRGITMAQKTVTGKVTDEDGEGLIGVSILVEGTGTGSVTDLDGSLSLSVPADKNVLYFSYTGFANQRVALNGRTILDVVLEPSAGFSISVMMGSESGFISAASLFSRLNLSLSNMEQSLSSSTTSTMINS